MSRLRLSGRGRDLLAVKIGTLPFFFCQHASPSTVGIDGTLLQRAKRESADRAAPGRKGVAGLHG